MCPRYGAVRINLLEWCVMNNDQCGMFGVYACRAGVHSSGWSDTALYPARGGDDPLSQQGLSFVYTCVWGCPGNRRPTPSLGRAAPPRALLCMAEGRSQ